VHEPDNRRSVSLKLTMAQVNPTVGDLKRNIETIRKFSDPSAMLRIIA